ncbi:MAG: DNA-directed RNA polymerase subunit delta [Acholeplasmatales bacterium]|nr:DNA-directed RNA polymerase subunit delta [Acholeplasmatales bacterium]
MNDKSMLEVAIEIMEASNEPKNIYKLIDEVTEKLGYGDDFQAKAQLYIDITTSAEFVYCGGEDDLWDLKIRQSLDMWDKSFFENENAEAIDDEDDEDNISMEDYNYVEDEESDEDAEEADEDEEEDESTYEIDESEGDEDEDEENSWDDDEENSWDDDEEEKYNDMMDDYEDLYEDK